MSLVEQTGTRFIAIYKEKLRWGVFHVRISVFMEISG